MSLTYEGLSRAANRIAHAVHERLGRGEEAVALLLGHDAPAIAALLGVLTAGKGYLPLDPASPAARTRFILEDAGVRLLLTDTAGLSMASALVSDAGASTRIQILDVDSLGRDARADDLALAITPDALASLYYTSGSTGRPKGVPASHRFRLVNARHNTDTLRIGVDDRLALLYAIGFSGSVNTIFGALLNGATLCPFDLRREGPAALAPWLDARAITIYHSPPPVFRALLDHLPERPGFPALRVVLLASDSLYAADVERFRRHVHPGCLLLNAWGATESAFFRPYFVGADTPISGDAVPAIGPAGDEDEIRLVDDAGEGVAAGSVGEIVVRSRDLSPGYWGRDDLTRERFRPAAGPGGARDYFTGDLGRMLADGSIAHVGRKDFQVKVRGYRVELEEVEAALREVDTVADAVVIGRPMPGGDRRLVAYVVPATTEHSGGAPGVTVSALRRALAARLPDYLMPAAFVLLPALPTTANGKVDRLALPDLGRGRPALDAPFVAASTPLEAMLAAIWAEVLGLDEVGVRDDFLELGGSSLLAAQVGARVRAATAAAVPLDALLGASTVTDMALVIARHALDRLDASEARRLLGEAP